MDQPFHFNILDHLLGHLGMKGAGKTICHWLLKILPGIILWQLWKAINLAKIDGVHMKASTITECVIIQMKEIFAAHSPLVPKGPVT